jgi:hypothetical protein
MYSAAWATSAVTTAPVRSTGSSICLTWVISLVSSGIRTWAIITFLALRHRGEQLDLPVGHAAQPLRHRQHEHQAEAPSPALARVLDVGQHLKQAGHLRIGAGQDHGMGMRH